MTNATTKWISLALLGLAIAAAVAFLATRLVSEQIGIASESVSAGYDLAPAVSATTRPRGPADANGDNDPGQNPPPESTSAEPPSSGGSEGTNADQREDEIEDREKEREDELEDLAKEREDREDEIRDREEDRRDD